MLYYFFDLFPNVLLPFRFSGEDEKNKKNKSVASICKVASGS